MLKHILLAVLLLSLSCKKKDYYTGNLKQDSIYLMNFYKNSTHIIPSQLPRAQGPWFPLIKHYEWNLTNSISTSDTNNVLMVVIKDEISISTSTFYCMAIFENVKKTEYMLVAPWFKNVIIQKSNVLIKKVIVVPKKEMLND
jgi:hypothetical protein